MTSESRRETGRLEAFSDGVFAFAITLLVLYLKDPLLDPTLSQKSLFQGLLLQWPAFFAFVTSFMTVLILWVGHHETFTYIIRTDRRFMFMNGFLLFFVTLTPFTTSLVADHILLSDSSTAAAIYSGGFLLLGTAWNLLWRYAYTDRRLIPRDVSAAEIKAFTGNFYVGPIFYASAFVVAFISGIASILLILAVAVFYAVGTRSTKRSEPSN